MRTPIASPLLLAWFALLSAYGSGPYLSAQETKPAARAGAGLQTTPQREDGPHGQASLVVAGYTRPGNPPDRARGGKIVPGGYLAGNPDFNGLGGTVFFAVYRLSREAGDVWGTGVKDFDMTFVPGVDYNDAGSPDLDTRAKYLYLYQVVNSRGLDPIGTVIFAADTQKGTQAIASTAVRLRVDPRYITSWGHFKSEGFTLAVMPEHLDGKKGKGIVGVAADKKDGAVRPAFDEDQDKEGTVRMAVSVNPSILGALDMNAYQWNAPAHRLERMRVNSATLNLAESPAAQEIDTRVQKMKKNNARPAAWVEEMLKASRTATPPALVRLVLSEQDARLFLQADWMPTGQGLLHLADHSTVFGFTTDLPPMPEPVGIATPDGRPALLPMLGSLAGDGPPAMVPGSESPEPPVAETLEEDMVLAVAPGVATGAAPGTVVGPVQPAALTPSFAGSGIGNALPNMGGFGAGIPFASVGGIGTAPPPIWGGGGIGGTGSTGGTTTGTPANVVVNTGPVNVTATGGNQTQSTTVNTNISLQNQQSQSQAQAQAQAQSQSQSQSQCQTTNQHVVPEPGAVVLALLGLPALLVLARYRRRRIAMATVQA